MSDELNKVIEVAVRDYFSASEYESLRPLIIFANDIENLFYGMFRS